LVKAVPKLLVEILEILTITYKCEKQIPLNQQMMNVNRCR